MPAWTLLPASEAPLEAVTRLPGATFFHSARWCRVLERGFGRPVTVALLGDDPAAPLAAWPAVRLKVGPVQMLYGVFPKGNFAGSAEAVAAHLDGLRDACRRAGAHMVRLIACEDDAVRTLPGGRCASHVRHVLDLAGQTPESLWAGYAKNIRRDVRVPQKAGLVARPMRRDEFPAFHRMMTQVFVRNAAATGLTPAFYEAVWDELVPDGVAEFLVADKDGEPRAAIVGIHDADTTYYFAGCSLTEALRDGPNDLLVHTLIASAARRGARQFDMLSSDAADAGLIRFKAKWGAQARPFDVLEWWFSSWRRSLWDAAMAVARHRSAAAAIRWIRGQRG
jgi:hypothetical protein